MSNLEERQRYFHMACVHAVYQDGQCVGVPSDVMSFDALLVNFAPIMAVRGPMVCGVYVWSRVDAPHAGELVTVKRWEGTVAK